MKWQTILEKAEKKYEEAVAALARPEMPADERRRLGKEVRRLAPLAELAKELRNLQEREREARALLKEPEYAELATEELEELRQKKEELEARIREALLEGMDTDAERSAIVEIRAGTGGEEAALFAGDLYRMYLKYAERKGWKVRLLDAHRSDLGGFKELVFQVEGKGAYSRLRYESGVHRVQRIPVTESGNRIHTSAATVAVLPEADPVEVEIKPEEIEVETTRAGGPGGQYVNKTESAVRIKHLPTGIIVRCQEERSQHQNRERALQILRAKLLELRRRQQEEERGAMRRQMIGTGDRSEKIRTYNFPQNRVTDHRSGLTLYRLQEILEGDLDELIDSVRAQDLARRLETWEP